MASGVEFDDSGLRSLEAVLAAVDALAVKVGILASKGGNADHDGITMLELAAIHEFGSPAAGIPERSFLRRTFTFKKIQLAELQAKLTIAIIRRKITPYAAMHILGQWGVAQVKRTITDDVHIPPPLKPATIAAKGSDRPLVDTGRLVGAISYEVSSGVGE